VKTHTGENLLCFGWIYNLYLFSYTRIGDFTWRVSDCEELVWSLTGDGEVGLVQKYNIRVHRLCIRALRAREANNQVSV